MKSSAERAGLLSCAPHRSWSIFSPSCTMCRSPSSAGYFKVKVLELLLFLSCLEPAMSQGEQRACTPFQVRLARDVIAYKEMPPSIIRIMLSTIH